MTKDNKIHFSIPGYFKHFEINKKLINLYKTNNNLFFPNIIIDSCYDSFKCIWNGGRLVFKNASFEEMEKIIQYYNDNNISLRHTFTNQCLTKDDYNDPVGNKILELSNNGKNGVTFYDIKLKEYIEEKYKNFYFLYSATQELKDITIINKYSQTNIVIVDYNLNNNFDILKNFTHPENLEFLVNEYCYPQCAHRKKHYQIISQLQKQSQLNNTCTCLNKTTITNNLTTILDMPQTINLNAINNQYYKYHINHFKIVGRQLDSISLIFNYSMWLIKPQYREQFYNLMIK